MIGFRPRTEVTLMADPFAELLLRLRKEAGRTQEQQAAAINAVSGRDTMTRREVSRYEQFENVPTNHTLEHIAAACGGRPRPLAPGRERTTRVKRRTRRT
jgi:transcriptional regulator with XRE-family HTH domain